MCLSFHPHSLLFTLALSLQLYFIYYGLTFINCFPSTPCIVMYLYDSNWVCIVDACHRYDIDDLDSTTTFFMATLLETIHNSRKYQQLAMINVTSKFTKLPREVSSLPTVSLVCICITPLACLYSIGFPFPTHFNDCVSTLYCVSAVMRILSLTYFYHHSYYNCVSLCRFFQSSGHDYSRTPLCSHLYLLLYILRKER